MSTFLYKHFAPLLSNFFIFFFYGPHQPKCSCRSLCSEFSQSLQKWHSLILFWPCLHSYIPVPLPTAATTTAIRNFYFSTPVFLNANLKKASIYLQNIPYHYRFTVKQIKEELECSIEDFQHQDGAQEILPVIFLFHYFRDQLSRWGLKNGCYET